MNAMSRYDCHRPMHMFHVNPRLYNMFKLEGNTSLEADSPVTACQSFANSLLVILL